MQCAVPLWNTRWHFPHHLIQWHKYTCVFIRTSSVSSVNSLPACSLDLFFRWVAEAKGMFSVKFSVLCELNWLYPESRQHSWLTIRRYLGPTWCRTWLKMLWDTLSAHPSCPTSKAVWFLIKGWLVLIWPSDNLYTFLSRCCLFNNHQAKDYIDSFVTHCTRVCYKSLLCLVRLLSKR